MKSQVVTTAVLLLSILSLVSGKDCFNQLSTFTPIKGLQYVLDSDQLLEVSVRVHCLVHINPRVEISLPTRIYTTYWLVLIRSAGKQGQIHVLRFGRFRRRQEYRNRLAESRRENSHSHGQGIFPNADEGQQRPRRGLLLPRRSEKLQNYGCQILWSQRWRARQGWSLQNYGKFQSRWLWQRIFQGCCGCELCLQRTSQKKNSIPQIQWKGKL